MGRGREEANKYNFEHPVPWMILADAAQLFGA